VVRDAETNAVGAIAAVRDALRDANFAVPPQPLAQAGAPATLRVSFLILPDGVNSGKLETVCLESVAADPAMPCVDQYFACLQAAGLAIPSNIEKARVQAFLASRPASGLLLGQAAHAGLWPFGHAAFDRLRQLVSAL
jgi:Protein of unknown function (DUF3226)